MSAAETPVDVDVLREEIRKTYTDVSTAPEQEFIFPTGRSWAQELGYPEPELARVPGRDRRELRRRRRTTGRWPASSPVRSSWISAAAPGTDLLIAAQMTGPTGRASSAST